MGLSVRWIDCDAASAPRDIGCTWEELGLPTPWPQVLRHLEPGPRARSLQRIALRDSNVLETRRNLLLAAPTNGGKSLVAYLLLLDAIRQGRRAVLVEPLRALARERYDELRPRARALGKALKRPLRVRLTTGDVRREDESLLDGPPSQGELIIATPERLEALLRRPTNAPWLDTIGMVVVDEAHLLYTPRRGSTLEYLLTSFLTRPAPPRMALLSATLREIPRLQTWLEPCDLIQTTERWPPLRQRVCVLEDGEETLEVLQSIVAEILTNPEARLLLFVYQTRTAEKLARLLPQARAYHARMTPAVQKTVRESFTEGGCRCLITTTALAQGVNLPATHVIVYETTFGGVGPLSGGELLQMTGRAGRGETQGEAIVFVRPSDAWSPEGVADQLRSPLLSKQEVPAAESTEDSVPRVAAYLARQPEPQTALDIAAFFARSLHGSTWAAQVPESLRWLADPNRTLAHADEEGRYRLTALGTAATRAILPLPVAAGLSQLLRDLLQLDPTDQLLTRWKPLDFLIVLSLLHGTHPKLRPYSAPLVERVENWMESHPQDIPMLYREWLHGDAVTSRASEVLGSLGVKTGKPADAHKLAYNAAFHAIVLWERGQGRSMEDLVRAFRIEDFTGAEERWRDECLWLLTGFTRLLEVRCFYWHLKETCHAGAPRIKRVKRELLRWMRLIWEVEGQLIYCSPLGGMLQQMRRIPSIRIGAKIGIQTIRRLEAIGIDSVDALEVMLREDSLPIELAEKHQQMLRVYLHQRNA